MKKNFSQQHMADLIQVAKVTVGRWERGESTPRRYYIEQLCEVLHCQETDLGFFSEEIEAAINNASKACEKDEKNKKGEEYERKVKEGEIKENREDRTFPLHDPSIPIPLASLLIGREHDLARIKKQLCQSEDRVGIVALNGMPGVGKTSLAAMVAHDAEIRAYFSDGILWAGLGPTPNGAGLLSHWGILLGLSETYLATLDIREKKHALQTAIGTQSMLFVLDDVWHLDDILTMCIGGPRCAYLITTRFPMIAAYAAHHSPILVEELDEEHSMQLLHVLAPKIVQQEKEKARQLVRAVGGLPLALTLIGSYLRKQSYNMPVRRAVIALERLSKARERFQLSESPLLSEAHPSLSNDVPISLEAILGVTDDLLTPAAREALYALAVFPSKPESFSEEAALAVAHCSTEELDELLDAGLLEYHGCCYQIHQIIADYAHLQGNEQKQAT